MEVRVVNWDEFPKEHHKMILQSTECGEYIDSLPYRIPKGLTTFKIPLYATGVPRPQRTESCCNEELNLPQMVFQRVSAMKENGDKAFVWMREI